MHYRRQKPRKCQTQGGNQNWHHFCTPILYQILTDFQNYFTVRIRRKFVIILSWLLKIPPQLKCVATLPCEMSSVLKATIENETSSIITTHFKTLTTGSNVYIVSVIVKSNCHILQFLHQMFIVSALLVDDAFKPATPLTSAAINETLRHTQSKAHMRLLFSEWLIQTYLLSCTVSEI